MKRIHLIFSLIIFVLLFNHLVFSQYKIENSVFGTGGVRLNDADNNLIITTGQSFIGRIKDDTNIINSGFWFSIIPPLKLSGDTLNLQALVTSDFFTDFGISNQGLTNAVITGMQINGIDSSLFTLENTVLPDTIRVGGSKNSTIKFSPSSSGEKRAYLLISSNAISSPDSILLKGRGISSISVQSPGQANLGESTVVNIGPPQNFQFTTNQFFYRKGGQTSYSQAPMTLTGDNYSVTIAADSITERGIQYYIVFSDGINTVTYPENDPQNQPASIQTNITEISYRGNNPQPARYQMISIPLTISNPQLSSVFEDDYGSYNKSIWRLFRWNPEENIYNEYSEINTNFQPGTAFWLITREGKQFDIDNANSVSPDSFYTITLQPGYNQISNPFAFPVAWDSVVNSELIRTPLRRDNENQVWANQNILYPWEGYFVQNDSSVQINIQVPPIEASANLLKKNIHETIEDNGFIVQINSNIELSEIQDNQIYVGTSINALHEYDKLDILKPPSISNELNLSILSDQKEYIKNIVPIDPVGAFWNLKISSQFIDKSVTIKFEEKKSLPEKFTIWLLDLDKKISAPVIRNTVTINMDGYNERLLKLIIGTEDYAKNNSESISLLPAEYTLFQNFPNPFNPATNIYYTLKENSLVTLEIFDILGRKVKTLLSNELQEAGIQNAIWSGTNNLGNHTASGIYIYHLKANNFRDSKKMVLVR